MGAFGDDESTHFDSLSCKLAEFLDGTVVGPVDLRIKIEWVARGGEAEEFVLIEKFLLGGWFIKIFREVAGCALKETQGVLVGEDTVAAPFPE
jgi:hypothetical protein